MLEQKVLLNQMPIAIKNSKIDITQEESTKELATNFAYYLKGGEIIFLYGEMGVGKTTFVRYLINEFFIRYIPAEYPLGILFINILGCFFIGYYLGTNLTEKDGQYYLFVIGFLGSFTTMSAFTYQTINMLNTNILIASSYIIATIILTIAATAYGASFSK